VLQLAGIFALVNDRLSTLEDTVRAQHEMLMELSYQIDSKENGPKLPFISGMLTCHLAFTGRPDGMCDQLPGTDRAENRMRGTTMISPVFLLPLRQQLLQRSVLSHCLVVLHCY
jgi:hypothetical protein